MLGLVKKKKKNIDFWFIDYVWWFKSWHIKYVWYLEAWFPGDPPSQFSWVTSHQWINKYDFTWQSQGRVIAKFYTKAKQTIPTSFFSRHVKKWRLIAVVHFGYTHVIATLFVTENFLRDRSQDPNVAPNGGQVACIARGRSASTCPAFTRFGEDTAAATWHHHPESSIFIDQEAAGHAVRPKQFFFFFFFFDIVWHLTG